MLFCNLTPLYGRFVNAIVFCRKSEFCEYITPLHIQHSIYVRQLNFRFTMKQIASKFCNVSFAGQYIRMASQGKGKRKEVNRPSLAFMTSTYTCTCTWWFNIYTSSVFCCDEHKKNFDIHFFMKLFPWRMSRLFRRCSEYCHVVY